jgi:nucleoside 2-deoxyribosyltransferase
MDRVADGGVEWRRDMRYTLEELQILWLDPTRKPIQMGLENDESRKYRKATKAQGNYSFVTKEMKPIRCVDLRMVDISDFLIVNLDLDIHACGTYEEIFLANRQKKPVFVHVEQGKNNAPDWLFAALPHEYFHSTWEQVYDHVRYVATNPKFIDSTGRWYFFDWMGKEQSNGDV